MPKRDHDSQLQVKPLRVTKIRMINSLNRTGYALDDTQREEFHKRNWNESDSLVFPAGSFNQKYL